MHQQEWPALREADDASSETTLLSKEVFPIQKIEEQCGIDFFATRRRWAKQTFTEPRTMFLEVLELARRAPGATMALLGLFPLNETGDYSAAEEEGRKLRNAFQSEQVVLESPSGFLAARHSDHGSGEFADWMRKIHRAIVHGEEDASEAKEALMRSRQEKLQELLREEHPKESIAA